MTLNQIVKEITRLDIKLLDLNKKLHKTQSTQVEIETQKVRALLCNFERIKSILEN